VQYQICRRCVMDTSDPFIEFDEAGNCNHCKRAMQLAKRYPRSLSFEDRKKALDSLLAEVKRNGRRKRYDCIIGLSGGVDSSYVACRVKDEGLRPLAVHLDNGWNSELAVKNIENICSKLNIDLYTVVLDWEEFKSLQLAFLKASTPDSEVPSDHAIVASLHEIAKKECCRYIITGYNSQSESILPSAWSQGHFDWRYIKSVNRRYGTKKLKKYPHYGYWNFLRLSAGLGYVHGVKMINLLDYLDYDKEIAKSYVTEKVGWRNYGRKHGESNYTKIYQEYILPEKFGFDKRRAHYSSLIMSGQLTREVALEMLNEKLYETDEQLNEDLFYFTNKLGISKHEFREIMETPPRSYFDFPNYQKDPLYHFLANGYRFLKDLGLKQ